MMHSARQHCANSLVAAAALADAFPGAGAADRVSWRRLPHPRGARSVCLPHAVRHQLEPRRGGVWPRRWQLAARWAAPRRTSHQVRGWCGRGRGFIGGCVGGCGGGGCGVTWWLWLMLCGVVCMCVCQMMVPCIHTPSASPMCTYPAPDPPLSPRLCTNLRVACVWCAPRLTASSKLTCRTRRARRWPNISTWATGPLPPS